MILVYQADLEYLPLNECCQLVIYLTSYIVILQKQKHYWK